MDHAEALELIEQAAFEPDGLERLMSGDTAESAALAGHLVGCPDCTAALAATRRTAEALRLVADASPSPDLRARTLALVAAIGRPRGESVDEAGPDEPPTGAIPRARGFGAWVPRRRFALAALGAAAVFALLAAGSFVAADLQGQLERTHQEAARLHDLYGEIETILQTPTARSVALLATDGQPGGAVILDAATQRIAVLSDDLTQPPAGMEYRCWVEAGGQRTAVGRMWFEDGLAYWAGGNAGIAAWPRGATFGVSLEAVGQPASEPAVLSGSL
jgi:Anti-sigma-K factor rskA